LKANQPMSRFMYAVRQSGFFLAAAWDTFSCAGGFGSPDTAVSSDMSLLRIPVVSNGRDADQERASGCIPVGFRWIECRRVGGKMPPLRLAAGCRRYGSAARCRRYMRIRGSFPNDARFGCANALPD
jgi:hypothetical protein